MNRIKFGLFIQCQLLLALISTALGDIRCFCNLAHCTTSNYMCKSIGPRAACYSEYLGPTLSLESSRHGCVERLPSELQDICTLAASNVRSHVAADGRSQSSKLRLPSRFPSLTCCQQDMCNYVGKLDVGGHSVGRPANQSHKEFHGRPGSYSSSLSPPGAQSWPDLWWFKIVVIAVPVGGSAVLVLLILLAIRLLKQDSKRQRNLTELRKQRERHSVKPDLLLMTSDHQAHCEKPIKPFPGSGLPYDTDYRIQDGRQFNSYNVLNYNRINGQTMV
ncbi:BMP and activin membrane-bound inhibitor -like protein [Halotydeus destructor]|nr:BMP and activin membrane-bound inhibitor -like protein [Halotydeus destructor]